MMKITWENAKLKPENFKSEQGEGWTGLITDKISQRSKKDEVSNKDHRDMTIFYPNSK